MTISGVARPAAGLLFAALLLAGCQPEPLVQNSRPRAPSVTGPEFVLLGDTAHFQVTVYDPDGDQLRVFVAWGDGDTADFGEFAYSGQVCRFSHRYRAADTFEVRARCHDLAPLFSDWSSPRPVVVAIP